MPRCEARRRKGQSIGKARQTQELNALHNTAKKYINIRLRGQIILKKKTFKKDNGPLGKNKVFVVLGIFFDQKTRKLVLLGKFEYGGGPNFKVVLEC